MVTSANYKKEHTDAQKALVGALEAQPDDPIVGRELELAILKNLIERNPKEAKEYLKNLND